MILLQMEDISKNSEEVLCGWSFAPARFTAVATSAAPTACENRERS